MHSNDFMMDDARGLELEIERHCAGLGLNCSDQVQVHQFARDLLQNLERLKKSANKGDRSASARVELFGMVMLLHEVNIKTYGSEYMNDIEVLENREPAWLAISKAIWGELKNHEISKV